MKSKKETRGGKRPFSGRKKANYETINKLKTIKMKIIKVKTDFGILDLKVRKTFEFLTHKFALVDYPVKYMNSKEPLILTKCVSINKGMIAVFTAKHHGQTLKDYVNVCVKSLEVFLHKAGSNEAFLNQIETFETINP